MMYMDAFETIFQTFDIMNIPLSRMIIKYVSLTCFCSDIVDLKRMQFSIIHVYCGQACKMIDLKLHRGKKQAKK